MSAPGGHTGRVDSPTRSAPSGWSGTSLRWLTLASPEVLHVYLEQELTEGTEDPLFPLLTPVELRAKPAPCIVGHHRKNPFHRHIKEARNFLASISGRMWRWA